MFEREDWTLFRSLNTLGQKAGVPVEQVPQLVAKELVDNALDAGGRCRVGFIADNGIWVEDDGDGIPGDDNEIAALFSVRRPLTSSKILRRPSRGALGNGLRVVAGAILSTGGHLEVTTRDRSLELVPQENTGETIARRIGDGNSKGCRVAVRFGPAVRVNARTLDWANAAILMSLGESSYKGRSSPHWYDSESFYELLQASGNRTVRELIAEMQGCAEPKAGKISGGFKNRLARELDRAESERLLVGARSMAKPVRSSNLGKVGRLQSLPVGYAIGRGQLTLGSARSETKAELPVVLEAWAGVAKKDKALLFINRTPVTGELQAWHVKTTLCLAGCGINDEYYEVPGGRQPVELWINIDIPHMPITTDGKEPDISRFMPVVQSVARKAIRDARRKSTLARDTRQYKKDVIVTEIERGAAEASGGGEYRFAQRQLFYAIRPRFMDAMGEEPVWGYFCQVLTEYENENGDIHMMYRDPRGIIYHPHTGEEIPLGTLYVENYRRPAWLFNKVLYCEKEGFFSVLRAVRWPERNDCALMTSKGFSTRAARDLVDLLAATGEECQFFCIHDADASGTMIYQTLQEATKARAARKVQIINLGIEPAEARDLGLQVEQFKKKNSEKELPVAEYVPPDDRTWLQANRVELNAMTTPQFLEWLGRKFEPYRGKVVPPADVLRARLEGDIREGLRRRITRSILRRANLDERVDRAVERRAGAIAEALDLLPDRVRHELQRDEGDPWVKPISRLARKVVVLSKSQGRSRP